MHRAANDSSRLPPLSDVSEQARARLRRAYDATELAWHDITFEIALADDCLRRALGNVADSLERAEHASRNEAEIES